MSGQVAPTAAGASHTALMQILARGIALVLMTASTALITRQLNESYVNWATVLSAVALVTVLLEPGFSPVVVRHLTLDSTRAPSARAMVPVRLVLGVVALLLTIVIAISTRGVAVLPLAALIGASVLARALVLNATPWLQVDQRLHRATILEAGTAVVGFVALAAGILLDLPTPVLGLLTFTAPTILLAILVNRELVRSPSAHLPSPGPQWPKVRVVIVETIPLAVAIVLVAVYTRTSVAFVNATEDDAEASRFFFAFLFAEQTLVAAGIIAGAILPLLASRSRVADLLTDDIIHRLLIAVAGIGSLVGAALLVGGRLLTVVIGGPAMDGAERYIWLLSPMAAVSVTAMVLSYAYIATGRGRRYLVFSVLGLVGNLALNLLFTFQYGAAASARITWATEALILVLPLGTVAIASAGGRLAALRISALLACGVLAAELAADGFLPAPVAGAGLVVAVLVLTGGSLVWAARSILDERRLAAPAAGEPLD